MTELELREKYNDNIRFFDGNINDIIINSTASVNEINSFLSYVFSENHSESMEISIFLNDFRLLNGFSTLPVFYGNYITNNIKINFYLPENENSQNYRITEQSTSIDNLGVKYSIISKFGRFNSVNTYLTNEQFVNYILSKIPNDASDLEKVVFVSNFIINYYNYDEINKGNYEENDVKYNVDQGEFAMNSKGVCRHYAEMLYQLLTKLKIKNEYIGSDTIQKQAHINLYGIDDFEKNKDNPEFIGHAFNLVYLDDKPYWIDLTWIDKEDGLFNNDNFLSSTSRFLKNHEDFIEVYKHKCLEDYDYRLIASAINNIINTWDLSIDKSIVSSSRIGRTNLANDDNYFGFGKSK